jgi:capsular polysaccharide biosynthesis protein
LPTGAGSRAAVERMPLLPPSSLSVPAPAFGGSSLDDIVFHPSGDFAAGRLRREATPGYLIRGATLHGIDGTVTVGDQVIADTLPEASRGLETLWLPDWPVAARLQAGYHMLAATQDNYFHWLIDVLARYRQPAFDQFARSPEATSPPLLLQPPLDSAWKRQSHALLIPKTTPRLSLEPAGRIDVAQLLYVPELSGGTMNPPPALLEMFDSMRASAMAGVPMRAPWRKLYVSRQGNRRRVLANEAEVALCVEAAGFAIVQTETMPVAEQIRLFAEASHIIAPHGAALANIGFCQPGAALCELHMAAYVHQAYRSLAALRGLRYGCLVGEVETPPQSNLFDNSWRLDISQLEAVLGDPAFMGDMPVATADVAQERGWWGRLTRRAT